MHAIQVIRKDRETSVLGWVGVADLEGAPEQVLRECINWVIGLRDADVLQSFCEEGHEVILKIHADILRLCV